MGRRVVIIGAGITGTLTAVRLRRAGWEVVLLEARHVGAGSSSRTAAGIRQQFSTPETVIGMRYSVDVYRRFPEEVGGMIVPIVENGYLFLLGDAAALEPARRRVELQRSCGLAEVELLNPAQTAERFPFVDAASISGATWCPSDGFLRPEVVYGEAAATARARGVEIVQRCAVVGAEHLGGRITALRTSLGRDFGADLYIDATNAWSPRLAQVLGGTAFPIDPIKRYLWFIQRGGRMSGPELLRMPMVVSPRGAYCHPENEDTLMTGWAHEARPEPDFTDEDQDRIDAEFSHRGGVEGRPTETWAELASHMPQIGDFEGIHATTSGFYGSTPDHNPFLCFDPQVPNLLRLAGFSGHGAMFGPFTARVAEALAEAGEDIPEVEVLGRRLSLAAFQPGREFHAEDLVI
jgi:glycine/D-amino acid oxidase-like deaminating enzyme